MLMLMVLVITCMLLLLLVVMMLLMRLLTRGRVLLRVSQSFVVHGGVEAQLMLPGLLLLVVVRVVEVREGLLARIGVGIQVCGGEVEQGVLLRVIEVLHGAWDSGFRAIYSDG